MSENSVINDYHVRNEIVKPSLLGWVTAQNFETTWLIKVKFHLFTAQGGNLGLTFLSWKSDAVPIRYVTHGLSWSKVIQEPTSSKVEY